MKYALILILVNAAMIGLIVRTFRVYTYRILLLAECSAAARRDLAAGLPWEHRYDYLNSVSFASMSLRFWRSMDSFYPDRKECLS